MPSYRKVNLTKGSPVPAVSYKSASVLSGSKLYVFGNGTNKGNQLWALDLILQRWQRLKYKNESPCPRISASMVAFEQQLCLFGGLESVRRNVERMAHANSARIKLLAARSALADTWLYDINKGTWSQLPQVLGLKPRRGHTATLVTSLGASAENERRSENVVDDPMMEGDTYDSDSITQVQSHIDLSTMHMIVIGGASADPRGCESAQASPVWSLDIIRDEHCDQNTYKWRQLPTTGCLDLIARYDHTTTLVANRLWVVGGLGCGGKGPPVLLEDVVSLDLDTLVWNKLQLAGPCVLTVHGHSACASPTTLCGAQELLIVGGSRNVRELQDKNFPLSTHVYASAESKCRSSNTQRRQLPQNSELCTTPILALDLSQKKEAEWRPMPWRGKTNVPLAGYGGLCLAWRADQLDIEALKDERGEELEQRLGPGGLCLNQRERDPASRAVPGVSVEALINQTSCILFFGGTEGSQCGNDHFLPADNLYLYDYGTSLGEEEEEEEEEKVSTKWRPLEQKCPSSPTTTTFVASLSTTRSQNSDALLTSPGATALVAEQLIQSCPAEYSAAKKMIIQHRRDHCYHQEIASCPMLPSRITQLPRRPKTSAGRIEPFRPKPRDLLREDVVAHCSESFTELPRHCTQFQARRHFKAAALAYLDDGRYLPQQDSSKDEIHRSTTARPRTAPSLI